MPLVKRTTFFDVAQEVSCFVFLLFGSTMLSVPFRSLLSSFWGS